MSRPVSRRQNRFVGERGRPFTLAYACHGLRTDREIGYTLETRGDTVIVRPQLEDLAYLTVIYTEGAMPDGRRCNLYLDHTGNSARILWPGYARIGPLPAGPYLLWRWWLDDPRVDPPDRMEVTLKPGHNGIRW